MIEVQLCGGTVDNDTGELFYGSFDIAIPMFLTGRWWKLSFTLPGGKRIRLLKQMDGTILPTIFDSAVLNYVPITFNKESL